MNPEILGVTHRRKTLLESTHKFGLTLFLYCTQMLPFAASKSAHNPTTYKSGVGQTTVG
jgi:hypothetical protein